MVIMTKMTNLASAASLKETVFSSAEKFSAKSSLETWQAGDLSWNEEVKSCSHLVLVELLSRSAKRGAWHLCLGVQIRRNISELPSQPLLLVASYRRVCAGYDQEAGSLLLSKI